jgi:sugar phosphate isomerase/epimerase
MVKICKAVDHPGFGVLLHFKDKEGDKMIAPWAMHTHISWEATHDDLAGSLNMLRATGYSGSYSVEHHSAQNEYHEVSIQLASVQNVMAGWG